VKPQRRRGHREEIWVALMIGNSRLHWAWFYGRNALLCLGYSLSPDSVVKHLAKCRTLDDLPVEMLPPSQKQSKQTTKIDAASVCFCCSQSNGTLANLSRCSRHYLKSSAAPVSIPHWELIEPWRCVGAGETWGWPMLVIDAGTALTLTADADHCLVGGFTVGLQLQSLAQRTGTACRT